MQENQTKNNRAIGIFDSGFGGLTVMSAVSKLLPKENLIYFGDTAHVPYGSKSKKIVTEFATKISKFLVKNDVKMIVIACNTASAFSLDYLKNLVDKRIDTIILGCTHYPLLKETIKKVIGNKINIVDSANAIALAVKKLLAEENLLKVDGKSTYKFYVSDGPDKFKNIGNKFLGKKILTVKKVEID